YGTWTFAGGANRTSSCGTTCAGGSMLQGLIGSGSASINTGTINSGSVIVGVRYSYAAADRKGNPLTAYLRLQVNGTTIMNGSNANWTFPNTGSASTWQTVNIPVNNLPVNAKITLLAPTTGAGPNIDVISIRLP